MFRMCKVILRCFFCILSVIPMEGNGASEAKDKTVLLAILARNKAHVLPCYLKCMENLDYDKQAIVVYINTNNNDDDTFLILKKWAAQNKGAYKKIIFEDHTVSKLPDSRPHEWTSVRFRQLAKIRNKSLKQAEKYGCEYYFVADCDNFLTPCTLKTLVGKGLPIIAPMLRAIPTPGDYYTNFFPDVEPNGYYKHSQKYWDYLFLRKVGTFRVPLVHMTYLIQTKYIDKLNYSDGTDDWEFIVFARTARAANVSQYICNEKEFGHFVNFGPEVTLEEEIRLMKGHYPSY